MGGHDENIGMILRNHPHAQTMRYMTSHLEMVKRAASKSRTEFFWLIASCCDYSNFDFDYIPMPWEQEQIHCWASGTQKFGDTLLVNVAAWKKQDTVEKLEWYNNINYHLEGVPRLDWPIVNASDNLTRSVMLHCFDSLYTMFVTNGTTGHDSYDMNLWENQEVIAFNRTGHVSMCPRDIKQTVKTQIYDWHYIKHVDSTKVTQNLQDIVFISYDEENADIHWAALKAKEPRAQRIHGVKGLVEALKAAANLATTDWFYAVFAKTKVHDDFQFGFQPDYLRHPANYVFLAYNPILDHSYGHGAIVLHNRQWLVEHAGWSLLNFYDEGNDITMGMPVVSIPVLSCINHYNETPWSAYRTAFREAYKLKQLPSIDDQYHLHLWLTSDEGVNGEWSKLGAADGVAASAVGAPINNWDYIRQRFDQYGPK